MGGGWRIIGSALALLLLEFAVSPRADAAGVGLRWDKCHADGGAINRSFACNTNAGVLFLVSSFVPGANLAKVQQIVVSLELASSSPVLPAWWALNGCRMNARSIGTMQSELPVGCPLFSSAVGILDIVTGDRGPNTERIEFGNSVPSGKDVLADQEYRLGTLRLMLAFTVGTGSCEGCATPVCIVVGGMSLMQLGSSSPDVVLTQPLNGTDSNYVTWQGGGSPVVGGSVGCPAATPVKRSAWGSVKALYR